MAFVDEMKIYAKAGRGGDGVVRWRREKGINHGGPAGGNGGNGGNIYALAVRDIHVLAQYRNKKEFTAERGENGAKKNKHGINGKDLDIQFPIGSVITNLKTGQKISLDKEGDRILLLAGGRGGRGNTTYLSSVNRSPKEFTLGAEGESAEFFIEVEMIADVGLIGLPNAGKTSLLNELTNAKGKVGAYPFTTIEPALGECYGHIIADVPGLIEGAAAGKGLGHKFLRHIRRTKVLAHLISLENEDVMSAYKTIRKELEEYDKELLKKKEIIVLTKTDLVSDKKIIKKVITKLKKFSPEIMTISIHDADNIKKLREKLIG